MVYVWLSSCPILPLPSLSLSLSLCTHSQLDQLAEVSLREMLVSSAGKPGEIEAIAPSGCSCVHLCMHRFTACHSFPFAPFVSPSSPLSSSSLSSSSLSSSSLSSPSLPSSLHPSHPLSLLLPFNTDIRNLNLSQNLLLSNWKTLADICSQLQHMQTLNLR